jgi:predicted DCC family thiol-disulfide oxidoreductase YuxK
MPDAPAILLYDGVCGLCARSVQYVLAHDRRDRFRFAPLQSRFAAELLQRHGKDARDLDTVYAVVGYRTATECVLSRAAAIRYVADTLHDSPLLRLLLHVAPLPLLNLGYRLVACNRYRWFGRTDRCELPRPEQREKFLAVEE